MLDRWMFGVYQFVDLHHLIVLLTVLLRLYLSVDLECNILYIILQRYWLAVICKPQNLYDMTIGM